MRRKDWLRAVLVSVLIVMSLLGMERRDSWAQDGFYVIPITSMTFRGNWNESVSYNAKDVVFHNGSSWFSLGGSNMGNEPGDTSTKWTMLAQKGDQGPVNPNADTVDGKHAVDFALVTHPHDGASITTGTVVETRIDSAITRDTELNTGLATKANAVHSHDNLYYSKAQVDAMLASLQSQITALQTLLQGVTRSGNDITFSGVNVHVVSGSGATNGTVNGNGNLIIGYNELRYLDANVRSGSHNLIVGQAHNFSSYGGIVAGYNNTIADGYASVSGGYNNTASGWAASVSGGDGNTANGLCSSVSGGSTNTASWWYSSVSGGGNNTAIANYASVSGGAGNTASGLSSSVSGGWNNTATYLHCSVSGGSNNTASEQYASVSGGDSNIASGLSSSVSGGGRNEAAGPYSSVSGGSYGYAAGQDDWIGGDAYYSDY